MATIESYVVDQDKFLHAFGYAPKATTITVRKWLYHERKMYVGNTSVDGTFRKQLLRKPRVGRSGGWPKNVAKAFKGYIQSPEGLNNMALHMGVGYRHGNKFTQGLAAMETGYTTRPTRSTYMPLPKHANLAGYGITGDYNNAFNKMMDQDKLDAVPFKGKMLFYAKGSGGQFSSLLFVGVKRAVIRKQFNFTSGWQKRIPSVMKHGESRLRAMLRGIERGKIEHR